jgi:hypothetical protein
MFKIIKLKIFLILCFLYFAACSKTDPVTGEKILIEPNPNKKAREVANKGDGILGNLGKKTNRSTDKKIELQKFKKTNKTRKVRKNNKYSNLLNNNTNTINHFSS